MKSVVFLAFLFAFSGIAIAAGQQNLDYCEASQNCTIGDFVFNSSFQLETAQCCNASIWFPNGTVVIENTTMTGSPNGFHNYSFKTPNTTGYYPALMDCFCSNTRGKQNLAFITVNSSEINLNLSGINITASGLTPAQNATLYAIETQTNPTPIAATGVMLFFVLVFLYAYKKATSTAMRVLGLGMAAAFTILSIYVPANAAGGTNATAQMLYAALNLVTNLLWLLFLAFIGALGWDVWIDLKKNSKSKLV